MDDPVEYHIICGNYRNRTPDGGLNGEVIGYFVVYYPWTMEEAHHTNRSTRIWYWAEET